MYIPKLFTTQTSACPRYHVLLFTLRVAKSEIPIIHSCAGFRSQTRSNPHTHTHTKNSTYLRYVGLVRCVHERRCIVVHVRNAHDNWNVPLASWGSDHAWDLRREICARTTIEGIIVDVETKKIEKCTCYKASKMRVEIDDTIPIKPNDCCQVE